MRVRLGHINLAIFALLLVLLAVYGSGLARARDALPAYLTGRPLEPVEVRLEREAVTLLRGQGDVEHAKRLLERAVGIDPNSSAAYVLGDVLKMEGDLEGALGRHLEYNRIAPWFYPAYLSLAAIYEGQGRRSERLAILERGRTHFDALVERFAPQPDATVDERYNGKAEAVHAYYREATFRIGLELGRTDHPDVEAP